MITLQRLAIELKPFFDLPPEQKCKGAAKFDVFRCPVQALVLRIVLEKVAPVAQLRQLPTPSII